MRTRTADEIRGFEFDWLASDADGHVALFSTAGGGYAPEEFLQDTDAHEAAIDALLASAPSTRARFAPGLCPELPNTWLEVAKRGLFAFDAAPNGGPYRLVAAPEVAAHVAELDGPAAVVVRSLILPRLRFSELTEIPEELLQCRPC
jgi:hypothetical protein